ncbi:MAG: hypothetical protein ACTS10_18960 [Kiloniellales bacterium]
MFEVRCNRGAGMTGLALLIVAALPFGAVAQDEHREALPEPAVPHVVGGKVYWQDHRLAALCRAFEGRFAKLPGSAVYVCSPQGIDDSDLQPAETVAGH